MDPVIASGAFARELMYDPVALALERDGRCCGSRTPFACRTYVWAMVGYLYVRRCTSLPFFLFAMRA